MLNKYKKSYTILKYEDINTVDLATAALKNIDKEYPLKTQILSNNLDLEKM